MKALIIDEPWITEVLSGRKIWEMRKTACHYRGQIALIRKGSGQVVGVAEVVDSLPPIESLKDYAASRNRHRIPPEYQNKAFADGWRCPWVLKNATSLTPPVSYRHPRGAVIWVNLDPNVAAAVSGKKRNKDLASVSLTEETVARSIVSIPTEVAPNSEQHVILSVSEDIRHVQLTGGNLRNNHIYLPLDFFPEDTIGGSNRYRAASKRISVNFKPGSVIETDIDGSKKILRARSAVGEFLKNGNFADGDFVCISRTGSHSFTFTKSSNV